MKTFVLLSLFALCAPAVAAPPNVLNFSGHLAGNAGALSGEASLTLALYDDPDSFASAHVLWSETSTVFVSEGRFHVLLGADPSNALPTTVLDAATVYVGVRVGGDDELRPRLRVASVPFSLRAEEAERLGGLAPEAFSPAGHSHDFEVLQGLVAVSQLPASVVLEAGLTTGLAGKSDVGHAHDAAYVNVGEANAVTGGMVQDGTLLLGDLGDSGCVGGQVAKWSEGAEAWVCANDDDTQLSAGTGVVLEDGTLRLDQATVVGWATAACFDTTDELADALDLRYAAALHLHDDRYPLASEVDTALAGKSDATHLHDARYPLATDVSAALAGKSDVAHLHDAAYVNEGQAAAVTTAMLANGAVSLPKLADAGCSQGQLITWDDANGNWACADDHDTVFDGGDFALSAQACPFGQLVAGIGTSGLLSCVDDVVYGAGTGLVLVGGVLNVQQGTIEGWARGTCYDTPAELTAALDTRYAALGHTHAAYATYADLNGALSTKADLFHEHADLYYLKDEADQHYVNEGQADAISGGMIADGSLSLADLGASACANGEIAKRVLATDGVTWVWGCAPDDDTQYTPGTGLVLTSGRFDVVQATIEGWSRGVSYDTAAELKTAVPAWDQDAADDLTTATSFQGQVTGLYTALTLANDVVTSATLVNGTVATTDLAAGAVTTAIIQNATIAPADLADSCVTSAAIANGTVGAADLGADSVTSGAIAASAVGTSELVSNSVTSIKIADGAILPVDLANDSVTGAAIANGAVGTTELATGAVTSALIQNYSITAVDFSDGAVDSNALANDVVTANKLATSSVTTDAILDATIATADLAAGAVTSAILAAGAVAATDLAADSVLTTHILNGTVATADLATQSVTSAIIANGTVANADMGADAISSANIVNGTVGAVDLAANSVTTAAIANLAVGTLELAANAVTSEKLQDGTVAGIDLANESVSSATIANGTILGVDLSNGAITNAQVSASAAIDPAKILGTAWTSANDGASSGLNADLLDGLHASSFAALSHSHGASDITDGSLTDTDISASAAIAGTKILPNFGAQSVLTTGRVSAASLRLTTTALAPTCDATTVGEVRLSSKYNLCVCGLFAGPAYAWRLPDGATACAW